MVVLFVLIVHVFREIDLRIALEHIRQIDGDGHAQAAGRLSRQGTSRLGHRPDEQHRLHHQHGGEEGDHAKRDSPVEASVPTRLHLLTKMLIPNSESRVANP